MLKMSDQPPARYVGMPTRLHDIVKYTKLISGVSNVGS